MIGLQRIGLAICLHNCDFKITGSLFRLVSPSETSQATKAALFSSVDSKRF
jgi:hypothetical protein